MTHLLRLCTLTLLALLTTGCSRAPSQADICQELAKELSTAGIIDSISQAKAEPGKCKALIIGDTGASYKTIRTVEWEYTVFDDGKHTSKIIKDENAFGDVLPVPETKEDISKAITKYVDAKLLSSECQAHYLEVLAGQASMYDIEARHCSAPAVITSALDLYDQKHPQPQAKPSEVCVELAKDVVREVTYNAETDGNIYALQLVPSSTVGYCKVSWFVLTKEWNSLIEMVTPKRNPFLAAFNYRTVGGNITVITSEPEIRIAKAGEYKWDAYDTHRPVKL